ncbi:hypothetical protein [Mastigocladopsis repens]|uniref:hypothetical protein n=1 Tax=Mastigocladopsis repens TaxID=221287 RepID=UPI00030D0471|nr:hypothetical protein [Mastigocladopsis repens]
MSETMTQWDILHKFFVDFDLPEKWWDLGLFYVEQREENSSPQYLIKLRGVEGTNWGGYLDGDGDICFLDFTSNRTILDGRHNYNHLPLDLNQWLDSFSSDEIFLEPVDEDDEILEPESPEAIEAFILRLLPKLETEQLTNIVENILDELATRLKS